jgi:hypothetical protein
MYELIRKFAQKPKTIFLVDGFGALVTAFLLLVMMSKFEAYFGMPVTALRYLCIIATLFCLYSFACYYWVRNHWQPYLRAISIANTLYCCLTIGLIIYHYSSLTILGIAYFVAESIIICILVYVELKTLHVWKQEQVPPAFNKTAD